MKKNSEEDGRTLLKNIRKQVKKYHDEVDRRAKELEAPHPIWEVYEYTPTFLTWGRNTIYRYLGDVIAPPRGVEDELKFTEQELKMWSTVHKLETKPNCVKGDEDE